MLVREKPPLRLDINIATPNGRSYHWSETEKDPANVPNGLRFSSTMPGGFESCDLTLPRKRGLVYSDVDRLSTLTVYGPGAEPAWEGRLNSAAGSSGDQLAVSPSLVGWQAHLEDEQNAAQIYIDSGVGNWTDVPRAERLRIATANLAYGVDYTHTTDQGISFQGNTGKAIPAFSGDGVAYLCPAGLAVSKVMYRGTRQNTTNVTTQLSATDGDDWTSSDTYTPTWDDTLRTQPLTTARANVKLQSFAGATHTPAAGVPFGHQVSKLAVYGNHGLTTWANGTDPDGMFASQIVTDAVGRWCPLLTSSSATIVPSDFLIPYAVFRERTTAAEIIRQVTRFGLQDWAVWENRTFYWAPRGTYGKAWRARASQSQLEETGADSTRLWNGVIVEYQDVDGSTLTVGPTGSGADTESSSLIDTDTENPANQIGIRKWTRLQMGTSTAAGATQVGMRFLEETKALDSSGRARLVGHVTDDKGVVHAAWKVRAGDTISFLDSADTSDRRIVRADYSHDDRSCSVDLDAPPQALDALLARLDVVIQPLGL